MTRNRDIASEEARKFMRENYPSGVFTDHEIEQIIRIAFATGRGGPERERLLQDQILKVIDGAVDRAHGAIASARNAV